MGLRDLFSRGPKLPEPVLDPFDGHEELRREVGRLQAGDWRGAAALLARTRGGDERTFVAGHFAEVDGWPDWIDEWHAADSRRPEPWLVRGILRIGWAWAVRGSGRAADVPEEAWPVFHQRLREAEADLQEAGRLDEADATPWGYLLLTARGLDLQPGEIRERFAEARRREPQGWLAPMMAVQSLGQKWSGTHEEMFAFAREAADASPDGSPVHAVVPLAHFERWLYFSMENPPAPKAQARYYEAAAVQDELRRAWARGPGSPAFRPGRFAATQRALFAFGFAQGDDRERARAVFEQLGTKVTETPWSHLGDPVEIFRQTRAAVQP